MDDLAKLLPLVRLNLLRFVNHIPLIWRMIRDTPQRRTAYHLPRVEVNMTTLVRVLPRKNWSLISKGRLFLSFHTFTFAHFILTNLFTNLVCGFLVPNQLFSSIFLTSRALDFIFVFRNLGQSKYFRAKFQRQGINMVRTRLLFLVQEMQKFRKG